MHSITKAVIIAGGKGTRLAPVAKDTPKALVEIGGISVLEHQVLLLKRYGIKEVWVLLGFGAHQIQKVVQNKEWGVEVHMKKEENPLGTAGALKQLDGEIQEDFFALSGDIMFDMDLNRLAEWHEKKGGILTLVVHASSHPFDSELVEVDEEGKVTALLHRPHEQGTLFRNLCVASIRVFSPRVFEYIPEEEKTNIEKHIIPLLLEAAEEVYAYNTPEYIKDMGTPERLEQVRKDYASGKIVRLSLTHERRAIFLDRDGVLNEEVDQLSRAEDFKLYEFAPEAIKKINQTDFLAIVVSNQPMVAKGFMTENEVEEVHKKLETALALQGAKLDAIYYCPHHPERGFEGERPELKIDCACRKPKIGLFLKAKEDFRVNLGASYMIGDQTSDILAGRNAGCNTVLVETGYGGRDEKYSAKPDFRAPHILAAVDAIIAADA